MAEAPGRQALGGLWLGGGAALGVLACVIALMAQQAHLGALRGELTQLRGELAAARRGETRPPGETQEPGELEPPLAAGVQAPMVWRRGKRGSEGKSRQQDQRQQHRKRSVLHLAPSHRSTNSVFQLQRGDQLSLRVPRANASLDLSPHGTFLGLVRL
nr:tumor necrosis factor ligand superfamily member 13 [Chrysemys picta bellii]